MFQKTRLRVSILLQFLVMQRMTQNNYLRKIGDNWSCRTQTYAERPNISKKLQIIGLCDIMLLTKIRSYERKIWL